MKKINENDILEKLYECIKIIDIEYSKGYTHISIEDVLKIRDNISNIINITERAPDLEE